MGGGAGKAVAEASEEDLKKTVALLSDKDRQRIIDALAKAAACGPAAVGDASPKFDLCDEAGNSVSLDSFPGKNLLIWWYPKADTEGCTKEGIAFTEMSAEFLEKDTQILGASPDTAEDNKAFKEKFKFPYPLITDKDKTLCDAFGGVKRWVVLIDKERKVKAFWSFDKCDDKSAIAKEVYGAL